MARFLIASLVPAIAACATASGPDSPQDRFFAQLRPLCGGAYQGRVVTGDAADRDFASSRLVMHVRQCGEREIRIPFHVGENRSRTWVITRTATGLRLKHDHRHEDGSEDALTQYGGETADAGTATLQRFPADDYSREMFVRANIPASTANVWEVEIDPARGIFAYALTRPNRHFRVEFDLSRPVPAPPQPWGAD